MSNIPMSTGLSDLLNPQVVMPTTRGRDLVNYRPVAKKGLNGVYNATIRFAPDPNNPSQSILPKATCYLVNPLTNRARYVDSYKTIGQPCVIEDMYWRLANSPSKVDNENAKVFSRNRDYYAIIQVIEDRNDPELEGRFMVWKFGQKIYEKIMGEQEVKYDIARNPFNALNGRLFTVNVKTVNGFNNYDASRFEDTPPSYDLGLRLYENINDRTNKNFRTVKGNEDAEALKSAILSAVPGGLSSYGFKEWDQETSDFVNSVILAYSGTSQTVAASAYDMASKPSNAPGMPQQLQYNPSTAPQVNMKDALDPMAVANQHHGHVHRSGPSATPMDIGMSGALDPLSGVQSAPNLNQGSSPAGNIMPDLGNPAKLEDGPSANVDLGSINDILSSHSF